MNESRTAEYPIENFLLQRWSPRAFTPEPIPEQDLLSIFEAAKWAPSSYNNQPWRFLYARRDTATWPLFLDLLVPFNQSWAKNASVLILVISNTKFDHDGSPSITHSFDAGAAWANLAIQAWIKGYRTHGMQGFDYEKARVQLEIPSDFHVEAMIALGKQGAKDSLPEQLQAREEPNQRRPIAESICEGKFAAHLLHSQGS
jgi:nitroreductase